MKQIDRINEELLAACKALLAMSGGPEGLNMSPAIDPRTIRQQAVKAITNAEAQ